MDLKTTIKNSIKNLLASKLRAILTMLGIIIGIGSVIMLTSLGSGVTSSVDQTFNKVGKGILKISLNTKLKGNDLKLKESDLMTFKDQNILKANPNVKYVSPVQQLGWDELKLKNVSSKINDSIWLDFEGTNPEFFKLQSLKILRGRVFTKKELGNNYGVIGNILATKIFKSVDNAIGKKITIEVNGNGLSGLFHFIIIGVVQNPYENIKIFTSKMTRCLFYIPMKNFMKITGQKHLAYYFAKINDNVNQDKVSQQLSNAIANFHKTVSKKYDVEPVSKGFGDFVKVLNKLNLFVGMIAAISLLVGGIGIMNIMLVIVTERTREIGIRKAVGATNRNILFLFLVESIIITLIGGLIGVVTGWFLAVFIGHLVKITPVFNFGIIFFAFMISALIGIIFGVYPASLASKLNPVDALRYE